MKEVTFSEFTKEGKIYIVRLNGKIFEFASERATKAFLAEAGRFATSTLLNINCIYSDAHRLYRDTWIYFDTPSKDQPEGIIRNCLKAVDEKLNTHGYFPARKVWIWIDYIKCVFWLQKTLYAIKKVALHRNIAHIGHACNSLIERLNIMEYEIEKFGYSLATGIVPMFSDHEKQTMEFNRKRNMA